MKKSIIGAAAASFVLSTLPTAAQSLGHSDLVEGVCEPTSHTAEGPLGSDLIKRQSRFYCNSAVITFFDNRKDHVMIMFMEKQGNHTPQLGFAGSVDNSNNIMSVDRVYLTPGTATVDEPAAAPRRLSRLMLHPGSEDKPPC